MRSDIVTSVLFVKVFSICLFFRLFFLTALILICYLSLEECGRYLETIKVYENKPADIIQGQMDTDYLSRVSLYLRSTNQLFSS